MIYMPKAIKTNELYKSKIKHEYLKNGNLNSFLKTCVEIGVHGRVSIPSSKTDYTCIPITHPRYVIFCTYNMNVSREPKLNKYIHILQSMCNTFNKHNNITIS